MQTSADTPLVFRALKHYPDSPASMPDRLRPRHDISIEFMSPRTTVTLPNPLPGDCVDDVITYQAAPLILTALDNGAAVRDGAYVFTAHNELLRESVDRLSFIDRLLDDDTLVPALDATPVEPAPPTVASLGAQRAINYFHWWIDVMPKCWMIEQSPHRGCQLLMPPLTQRFQRESLHLLGQHAHEMTRPIHRFSQMIAIRGLTYGSAQAIAPQLTEFAQWCRERANLTSGRRERKLFLSRKRARVRRLVNEEEVLASLGSDFESIELESLSVREQARLFSEAAAIAAPHGAGLTNILFCTQQTSIIEFMYEDGVTNTSYRQMAALLGHPYLGVGCHSIHDPRIKAGNRDMRVPQDGIAAAVGHVRGCR